MSSIKSGNLLTSPSEASGNCSVEWNMQKNTDGLLRDKKIKVTVYSSWHPQICPKVEGGCSDVEVERSEAKVRLKWANMWGEQQWRLPGFKSSCRKSVKLYIHSMIQNQQHTHLTFGVKIWSSYITAIDYTAPHSSFFFIPFPLIIRFFPSVIVQELEVIFTMLKQTTFSSKRKKRRKKRRYFYLFSIFLSSLPSVVWRLKVFSQIFNLIFHSL